MIEQHVVVYELSMDNIVLADDYHGRRFVCVDGMGSRTLIPVQEWSKWLNGQKIREFRSSLLRSIDGRSEEHTSELQSLMRISYAVFCLKKKKKQNHLMSTRRQ